MAGLNKEIEQLELQIKFLEIEIQKANTVNIDLQKQLTLTDVVKWLPQDNYCNVCSLPTDGEKCYSKQCPVQWLCSTTVWIWHVATTNLN